jgi:hypothetical protein
LRKPVHKFVPRAPDRILAALGVAAPMLNASVALSLRLPVKAAMQRFGRSPVARLAEKATLAPGADGVFDIVALRPALFGQTKRVVLGHVPTDVVAAIAPDLDPLTQLMIRVIDLGDTHLPAGDAVIFVSVWPKKMPAIVAMDRPLGLRGRPPLPC